MENKKNGKEIVEKLLSCATDPFHRNFVEARVLLAKKKLDLVRASPSGDAILDGIRLDVAKSDLKNWVGQLDMYDHVLKRAEKDKP